MKTLAALTRRHLLASTPVAGAAILTACSAVTVSQVAQYATVVENAAADVLTAVAPAASISAATVTTVTGYLTVAKTAAAAIINGAPAAGASWEQQLYDAIKAVLPIAAPLLSVVPGVGLGLAALQAVLPIVASWLGLTGAAPTVAVAGIPAMTAAQALRLYGP